jgi:hypothetical protein
MIKMNFSQVAARRERRLRPTGQPVNDMGRQALSCL